jgi:hypothetical protein
MNKQEQEMHYRSTIQAGLAAAALCLGASAHALTLTPGGALSGVSVTGTTSIYDVFGHAGNTGGDYGPDAPAVQIDFAAGASNVFTFSATGLVSCCSDSPNISPDGGSSSTTIVGINGLSSIAGNANLPLVGVFTSDVDPYGSAAPAALNFDAHNPTSLSPQLNQVFYIGDGLSGYGNSAGTPLTFTAPTGATRLYLGVIDAYSFSGTSGYYNDNKGAYTVGVNLSAVPEPQTSSLVLAGAALALVGGLRLRTRQ